MVALPKALTGGLGIYIALVLVVFIAIIYTSKDMTTAVVMIGVLSNSLRISVQLHDDVARIGDDNKAIEVKKLENLVELERLREKHPNLVGVAEMEARVHDDGDAPPPARHDGSDAPPHARHDGGGAPARSRVGGARAHGHAAPERSRHGEEAAADEAAYYDEADERGHERFTSGHGGAHHGHDEAGEHGAGHYRGAVDYDSAGEGAGEGDETTPPTADEQNARQVRSRNVPERVWAAARKRKGAVEGYVAEELDEKENSVWWGQHEY